MFSDQNPYFKIIKNNILVEIKNNYEKVNFDYFIIVDDSEILRLLLQKILEMIKIPENKIITLDNGIKCIELLKNQKYKNSIIITDVKMPDMDGYTMSLKLRKNDFKSLIIVISGVFGFQEYKKAYKNGINYFIHKPIDFNILKEFLENIDVYK